MKLPTITIIQKPETDAMNLRSICIRVTYQGVRSIKSLGIKASAINFKGKATGFKHVLPADAKYQEKNAIIKKEYERLESAFYAMLLHGELQPDQVKAAIENKATGGLNFQEIATDYLSTQVKNEGSNRRWTYCQQLVHDYAPHLTVRQIDKKWLTAFEDFLKVQYENANTRLTPLKFVRAVINYAMKRGVDMAYPFGKGQYSLPAEEKTKRNYLSDTQLAAVEKMINETHDKTTARAGRWFLLQIYSGMRYSDIEVWTPDHVKDGRIYFADVKTETPHFIPLYKELQDAIDGVAGLKPMAYEHYKRCLRAIGIAVNLPFILTSHVGRHTFAVHHLEKGGTLFYLKDLLGHADIKTTLKYAKITNRGIEEEMKRVRGKK